MELVDGYAVPGALVPLKIDVDRNVGEYVEPHLWMRYRIRGAGPEDGGRAMGRATVRP